MVSGKDDEKRVKNSSLGLSPEVGGEPSSKKVRHNSTEAHPRRPRDVQTTVT